ncbi:MAG: hypothetical protein M1830_001034 [Pleopsidium flavum]|nr:MAG: hypothetical protein M1830_001034 [Pleopsidium flavum]
MILKVHREDATSTKVSRLENMHIAYFPEMVLFLQDLKIPDPEDASTGKIIVTYQGPDDDQSRNIEISVLPETSSLDVIEVTMHRSPTKAYDMGAQYNQWFSECFGYEVLLAYLGENLRPVLGNLSPNAANGQTAKSSSWFTGITDNLPLLGSSKEEREGITFADVAPFLVITEESIAEVSTRLPDDEEVDITKFRPNIVLSGSTTAYDEDFWGGIRIRDDIDLVLTQNCARCKSLNIDYATGKPGIGETGTILKKLMKDRRVDPGMKYSPVFGRYGFLTKEAEGRTIAIGDEVTVTKRNSERTRFDWPGLNN